MAALPLDLLPFKLEPCPLADLYSYLLSSYFLSLTPAIHGHGTDQEPDGNDEDANFSPDIPIPAPPPSSLEASSERDFDGLMFPLF